MYVNLWSRAFATSLSLQEAYTRFQTVKKLAKTVSQEMLDSLKPYEETLTLALTKAQKDNNTVYLERVPPFADLPAIQGAPLARSVTPGSLFDASTEQLFTGLIPESR
jgi:programmed cell death 6-interacting protein